MKTNKEELKTAINDFLEETDESTQINLIKSKRKAKTNEPYAMTFYSKIVEACENGLTIADVKVLFKLLEFIQFGKRNAISISQKDLAEELNMTTPQISKSYKNLERIGVLIKEKRSVFISSNYLMKGDLENSKQSEAYIATRNRVYSVLSEHIKDQKELDIAVMKAMAY